MPSVPAFKIPESVLVVIHTVARDVLLIERADHPGFWQSVTGSKDFPEESFEATALREVMEETCIDARAPGCRLRDGFVAPSRCLAPSRSAQSQPAGELAPTPT